MSNVSAAVKLDFMTGRFYVNLAAALYVVGIVIGTVTKMPLFTVILVVVLTVFIAGGVFSVQEKNHGEKLYGTLPLRRRDMILGRYLYGLILGVVATVLAGLFGYLASLISGADIGQLGPNRGSLSPDPTVSWVLFWAAVGFAFVYYCLSVGIAFPVYLRFGFSKSYVLTMLPLYLIVLGTLLVVRSLDLSVSLTDTIKFFSDNVYLLPLIGLAGGLVLLAISLVVANGIYARKEI